MSRRIGLALAGVVAALTSLLGPSAPAHAEPPPETVAELVQRLRQDPVQVNTMMGVGDAAAVDAALTELVEQVPVPVYVVLDLTPQEREAREKDFGEGERLVTELSTELGDGLYVLALGETAETIIGDREAVSVGVADELVSDYRAGTSHFYEVSDYRGPEALRTYLGLRAVVEGPDAVEALGVADLQTEVPWAFPSSLEDHQDSLALRLGAAVVVPLTLLGLLTGGSTHLRRTRRGRGPRAPATRPGGAVRSRRIVLGGVVGVPLSAALTFGLLTPQVAPLPLPGEQEIAAGDAFTSGQAVYLSPDLAGWLDEEQQRAIVQAAESAPVTTRVALWYPTQSTDGLELTAWSLDEPATYVSASPDEVDGFDFALAGEKAWLGPRWEAEADPALFTQTVLELLAESAAAGVRSPAPIDYHPVLGREAGTTLGVAGVLAVVLAGAGFGLGWLLVLPLVRRGARGGARRTAEPAAAERDGSRGPSTAAGQEAATEGTVGSNEVGAAAADDAATGIDDRAGMWPAHHDGVADGPDGPAAPQELSGAVSAEVADTPVLTQRAPLPLGPGVVDGWTRSARYELGNLQRTLRFLGPTAMASPAAAAAQQHVAAAERLLAGSTGPADQLGAWVLTRRGAEAASAATALRPFDPTTGCWFHPEHPAGTSQRSFQGRSVSCCAACAEHLDQGREPEMLDLPDADGQPVHFHRSGAEPWASTGFGSDEPDLPARLLDRP